MGLHKVFLAFGREVSIPQTQGSAWLDESLRGTPTSRDALVLCLGQMSWAETSGAYRLHPLCVYVNPSIHGSCPCWLPYKQPNESGPESFDSVAPFNVDSSNIIFLGPLFFSYETLPGTPLPGR